MRFPLALACLPLLMGLAPAQEPLPERHSVVFACGFASEPPKTPREWRDRADLAMRVRIDSQSAFEYQRGSGPEHVITTHDATVLELFKGHPRGVVEGASQQLFQYGGRIRRADHMLTQTWNGFAPMPVGSDWVLFLEWSKPLDGFVPLLLENGAVQIVDGKVATKASLGRDWNGRPAEEFMEAIRR